VESNGGSLKGGAEAFMLFLHGAQLVLRSSVLVEFDLIEVNVTLEKLRSLGRCCLEKVDLLVAVGGAVDVLPVSLNYYPLPLPKTQPPSLLVCCFFVFAEMNSIWTAGGKPVII
jgi:hypothetical protein